MMKLPLRLLAVAVLALGCHLHAETPEEVVQRQIDAMKAGDWEKFTANMHEPALRDFQNTVITVVKAAPEGPTRDQALAAFFGGKTLVEVSSVTPSEFFGNFMKGLVQTNPAMKQGMAGAEAQILGHVDEGPDKTHVLVRMSLPIGAEKVTKMDVTSLQRDGDHWKALLKGDMQAIVSGLGRMLQSR